MSEDQAPRGTASRQSEFPGWIPNVHRFGARLALVRQAMGWGNVKLAAERCGIAPETWRTWERDDIEPKSLINACLKIAGVTGVDYRWLALGPTVSTQVVEHDGDLVSWHASGGRPPSPMHSPPKQSPGSTLR